jgi:hypothetical protein
MAIAANLYVFLREKKQLQQSTMSSTAGRLQEKKTQEWQQSVRT